MPAIYPQFSEQSLPPWLADIYRKMAEHAHKLAREEVPAYREQRLANIPEALKEAHRLSVPGLQMPYLEKARQMITQGNMPFHENYQQYMNPYQQAVINRIADEGKRTYEEKLLPAVEAHFLKLGQHGSSGHQKEARRAARDIHSDIMAKQAQMLERGYQQVAQNYNAEKARELEAANQMGALGSSVQGSRLADIAMLGERGRYEQQQDQAMKELAYQDYQRSINRPMEMLERQNAIMQGMPAPTYRDISMTPPTPQLNVLGQLGNLAANLLGSRLAAKKRGGYIKAKGKRR